MASETKDVQIHLENGTNAEIVDETREAPSTPQPSTPTIKPEADSFLNSPAPGDSSTAPLLGDISITSDNSIQPRSNKDKDADSPADSACKPAARKRKPKAANRTNGGNTSSRNTSTTLKTARMVTSLEDIASLRLWKGIVAEFVGTLLLTLVGCGSCINLRGDDNKTSPVVQIALCFGLSVGTIVWAIGHVSGGHINPAVTAAMLATRKISLAKGVFFVLFQLIGACVGAGILYGLTPNEYRASLGQTLVSDKISPGQGFGVELFITFMLVFTVFASVDGKRKDLNGSTPLTIGLSVTMCHLWAVDYTGSSMNTARSFGPALVMGNWKDHWVYWAGPIIGGVFAGILYENLFAINASLAKAKACLLTSDYDDDKYKAQKYKVRIIEEEEEEEEEGDDIPLSDRDSKIDKESV